MAREERESLFPDAYLREIVGSAYSALYRFRHDTAREPSRFLISADAHSAVTSFLFEQAKGTASREDLAKIERDEAGPLFLCGIPVEVSSDLTKAEVRAE